MRSFPLSDIHLQTAQQMDSIKHLFRYYPVVRKYIRANSGNTTEAEDIFQEALIIYWEKTGSPGFTLTSSKETFLFGICKNLWHAELKRRARMSTAGDDSTSDPSFPQEEDPEEERVRLAQQAIEFLEEKCKMILNLFYFQEVSLSDIAKRLKLVSETAARNQKFQCLEKARKKFKELNAKRA